MAAPEGILLLIGDVSEACARLERKDLRDIDRVCRDDGTSYYC